MPSKNAPDKRDEEILFISPIFQNYINRIIFNLIKIDVDKQGTLAKRYGIGPIPDVRIFYNNKEVKKIIGLNEKRKYYQILKDLIKKHNLDKKDDKKK